jgi:hypothetical protein
MMGSSDLWVILQLSCVGFDIKQVVKLSSTLTTAVLGIKFDYMQREYILSVHLHVSKILNGVLNNRCNVIFVPH